MSASNNINWVRLGYYIEECDERNNKLEIKLSQGISNLKYFQAPKQVAENSKSDKIVRKGQFAYNRATTRNGEKISIAYREGSDCTVSSAYGVFHITDETKLIPQYLMLFFKRAEFDRFARWRSEGSAHEFFTFEMMKDVSIPLPSIEVQRELVCVYNGLKDLAEENEALLQPLSDACQAFIVDCKAKYPPVKLGEYIKECDARNSGREYSENFVRGISTNKELIDTKANLAGVSLTSYKIFNPREFVYVADTSRRGDKIALALNKSKQVFIVSSIYTTFKCKKDLLPEYLMILLTRNEFDRYARFNSWGSARETFDWSEMCRVEIPLPPISIQQKVVDLYNCYEEAKKIAAEAREQLKTICPALVQKAAHIV